jgi:DNA-binding response OmpR family regulator
MLNTEKKKQASLPDPQNLPIVIVSPHAEDHTVLGEMMRSAGYRLHSCESATNALKMIQEGDPTIVVCERDLPDGTWKTLLSACEVRSKPPLLLVVSRFADESLWAEVLNLGGYDVLLKPFDRSEVTRVLGMASRQWSARTLKQPPGSLTATPSGFTAQYA